MKKQNPDISWLEDVLALAGVQVTLIEESNRNGRINLLRPVGIKIDAGRLHDMQNGGQERLSKFNEIFITHFSPKSRMIDDRRNRLQISGDSEITITLESGAVLKNNWRTLTADALKRLGCSIVVPKTAQEQNDLLAKDGEHDTGEKNDPLPKNWPQVKEPEQNQIIVTSIHDRQVFNLLHKFADICRERDELRNAPSL